MEIDRAPFEDASQADWANSGIRKRVSGGSDLRKLTDGPTLRARWAVVNWRIIRVLGRFSNFRLNPFNPPASPADNLGTEKDFHPRREEDAMVVRLFKCVPAAALGCAAFTVLSTGALAFFPPVPVGSDEVKVSPVSPIIPVSPPVVVVPPVPPPVVIPKEIPNPKTPCVCPVPVRPSDVPEPMTLISGLVGLGVLATAAAKRKWAKSGSNDDSQPK